MNDAARQDALRELALDLHWSWNHAADAIWQALDPELWEDTRNPWVILHTAAQDRIAAVLADPAMARIVDRLLEEKRRTAQTPSWFEKSHTEAPLRNIAYFSMEFMLTEALPIYSGGLGNVAGDQLKAASDLGVPVVGVSLLYGQGYFRQAIRQDGSQEALYPTNNPDQLPVRPLREANGEWLRLRYDLPGAALWIRVWKVEVGRRTLYLLDTNDPANLPAHRCITSELYGGGPELRLQQEMVLGIAGWQLLRKIGLDPEVCHLNEGHAALAALERAAQFREEHACSCAEALLATRAGNIFTTHTAVAAGFDRFEPALVQKYLSHYAQHRLGISSDALLALGRSNPADPAEPFNMAYLAAHASGAVNAVSALHEQVSQRIFAPLFPRWPAADVPIGHVTNGIHVPSWESAAADRLWTEAAGEGRWHGDPAELPATIRGVPASRVWQMRQHAREELVAYVRQQHARQLAETGAGEAEIAASHKVFNPAALTLGFARRFAPYKRPNLLLHDPERLARLLCDQNRPVQLIMAGKAHPADIAGQALVKQWNAFARRQDVSGRIVFLADYDMQMARHLVQGVDVWINTPERPWEASGTSGMKLLANGGLNLSELDGWWAEAYAPDIGWALGDGREHGGDPAVDRDEAEMLYALLEQAVVPEFYDRAPDGIPSRWISRIRESIARLTPRYSATRVVRDYTDQFYIPAARAYADRAADDGRRARDLVRWLADVTERWPGIHFGTMSTRPDGDAREVSVEVFANGLPPETLMVELYAEPEAEGTAPLRAPMRLQPGGPAADDRHLYAVTIGGHRPDWCYTPRIMPRHPELRLPLELPLILWQH